MESYETLFFKPRNFLATLAFLSLHRQELHELNIREIRHLENLKNLLGLLISLRDFCKFKLLKIL